MQPASQKPSALRFRRLEPQDRGRVLAIAAQIWEGDDYLPNVFDTWVANREAYFAGGFLGDLLVGCGRVMPFDEERGWLESLRIDPGYQGRGLGRQMARHVMDRALAMGLRRLWFATYFRNRESIRISEAAGFRHLATFSHLDLEDLEAALRWAATIDDARVREQAALPAAEGFLSNDWLFIPADLPERGRYLPHPLTIRDGSTTLLLSDNAKYPRTLEISWLSAPDPAVAVTCLARAVREAARRGHTRLHAMAPRGIRLEPFRQAGFLSFEQPEDTFVYGADVSELRLTR